MEKKDLLTRRRELDDQINTLFVEKKEVENQLAWLERKEKDSSSLPLWDPETGEIFSSYPERELTIDDVCEHPEQWTWEKEDKK